MSNLQNIRKKNDLTQAQLSELSGVSVRTLQKYETGERNINQADAMIVYKLAKALKCDYEDLLEGLN